MVPLRAIIKYGITYPQRHDGSEPTHRPSHVELNEP